MDTKRELSTSDNHHKVDLREAIDYLPQNTGKEVICKALKIVYAEDGREIALQWLQETKNTIPIDFKTYWEDIRITSFQTQNPNQYLKKNIYDPAKKTGWVPKRLRHGKQTKKPPLKRKQKQLAAEISSEKTLDEKLTQSRERNLPEEERSYVPAGILNMFGACYAHPFMKKDDKPEGDAEYKQMLRKHKIVDCEVRILEAVEHIREKQGREPDEMEVRYMLELNNRKDKCVKTIASHEELTTKTRFSNFLVKHGFVKFLSQTNDFDRFHEFLINTQTYPTVRKPNSWGEIRPGIFLFENGLFNTHRNEFIEADEDGRIPFGSNFLVCTEGSEQVRAPRLEAITGDSSRFLADKFRLWESFNGSVNVRITLGYAVACVFSREITEKGLGFPFLFKFGQRGTGKSSSMDWFMALFGYPNGNRQSVSKQNTIKGVIRRMTLPRSFPFFLDDFRNSDTNPNAPDLTSSFLNWYERIGTGMAAKTTDYTTIDTPMKACIVMTGNDKPTDPAAVSRMIILNYNRFLKREQLGQVSEITRNLRKFSQFLRLLLENYSLVRHNFFEALAENQDYLAGKNFEGRTVNNWAIVLAGLQCIEHFIPHLSHWFTEFEEFKSKICEVIRREESQQKSHNPLHEFLSNLEYFATQKQDPATGAYSPRFCLDHRHFRYRHDIEIRTSDGSIYYGDALAIHLNKTWSVLQDLRASTTQQNTYPSIQATLENSSYFLEKSVQVPLTKSIEVQEESNLRCYLLNIEELEKAGLVDELIEKAQEYEQNRGKHNY
ncbi:hypothetical protein [Rhodohalobacter sulfatireducens]|uniref:DUF927 domain-containing protein n=1 Tax=Rhodohalobacter sulfatireducens TaxID=2911366 RepID=A0ABS9KAB1_9BACT|nr:hypothetical protein [Rhodohalobacter sulfatireducens]MCG2587786.1 hypothetical protein [Rhodohalobacter sulfatireducens]